jgi:vacuolar protein sorting-associated protein 53
MLTISLYVQTRNHILALLGGPNKDPDANNATILLKALQKTNLFEKEVSLALQREYGTIFISPDGGDAKAASSKGGASAKRGDTKAPGGGAAEDGTGLDTEEGRASTEQEPVEPLIRMASSAYDNYMGPYIALEEQNMDEQLVESLEDRTVDTRGELPVFTTSTKLFVYIKGSITRCTALTKGYAFYLLHQAFQDSLRKYAQVLSSKLPPPKPQASGVGALSLGNVQFGKQDNPTTASYRIPKGEEVTVCHVIGTCEYCADTVEALEDLIRDTIDDEYKSKIDMMNQQEIFREITAKSITILVSGLENRLEDALKTMASTNWGMFDEVGEESDYVRFMHREIQPYVTTSRGLIPISYFRSFCDKFAFSFTEAYYNALVRFKRISEPGTQQLLLDVYNLKTLFLKLPVLESFASSSTSTNTRRAVPAGSTIAPAMYTKMVQKQFKRIETLLKLTGTPADLLIDVFKVQWVGGSALDLQTVMSLKGMKRQEQAAMLEKFGLDPATALKGATVNVTSATIVSERLQAVQDSAARVNSDLSQMRQKVDDFRKSFR